MQKECPKTSMELRMRKSKKWMVRKDVSSLFNCRMSTGRGFKLAVSQIPLVVLASNIRVSFTMLREVTVYKGMF